MKQSVATMNDTGGKGLSRAALVGIIAIFFGPLLLAYYLFTHLDVWAPSGQTNHGELIQPVRSIAGLTLETLNAQGRATGGLLSSDYWQARWTLVQIGGAECDLYCQAALFKTRQSRRVIGRDATRVQRLYVLTGTPDDGAMAQLMPEHPQLTVTRAAPSQANVLVESFGPDALGKVFLVDPLGNVMMRYDDESTAKGMIKDLKKLLKVSKIG